ncbi:MAG: 4-hydroxy-tetrahydrodipicolinate synthase [Gloeomargarita sp. SKYG116]|nr:4-hydroxy-tetrahydrodipicolinate synthase [Gloeomargarita sp. SKYG116]MDW8400274.1 4-hydroxy-tetrahydrodipicolinate synthase [Gloeomargarita sp. SKYGB_i_bin116]
MIEQARHPRFGRVITAMVTPFDAQGQVNYELAERLALHLLEQGSDALVLAGTTGESPTLTWEEEYELFRVVKNAVGDRAAVLAGTGANSTHEAVTATMKAAQMGLDGSLQVVPYYNKPPQAGLLAHFRTIARAVPDFPLMLYNIPGRTSVNLLPETVAQLVESEPNIVAIKEASGNLEQVAHLRRLVPAERLDIYSGDDSLTLPLLAVGAVGVVSVASHLVGKTIQQMIQAFMAGQPEQARALYNEIYPLCKALFVTTNPIPLKRALEWMGWPVGSPRLPLVPASPEVEQVLRPVMQQLQLVA